MHPPTALLLSLTVLFSLCHAVTAASCHPDDEAGLLGFKSGITSDPSGLLSSWVPGSNCCQWSGVRCETKNRVTTLALYGQEEFNQTLKGTISPALAKLKYLDTILLQYLKGLTGPFPNFLFNLPRIQTVFIVDNKLSGRIPNTIGKLTQVLLLSFEGNRFTGPIPSSVGELTQLTELNFGGNLLTGTIPDSIRQLKKLTYLSLEKNRLSGNLPDFFDSFRELIRLKLSYNRFSGKIPSSISSLSPQLQFLELGHNNLRGKIPDFLGTFQAILTIDLSGNHFSGVVPQSFLNLTTLFDLDLSHNSLEDPFPEMKVARAQTLDLSYNNFHLKDIPSFVTSSPNMFTLRLVKCGLKINLDDWKPQEYLFYNYIDLSENDITGSPVGLLNRTDYMRGFYASGNKLKFDLEKLRINVAELKELDLSRNMVFGKVPEDIAQLQKVNLSHNRLCGQLPPTNFSASAFAGNACLCGAPLPPCKAA
ncbi:MDIS1-interacting receptor like kinase 2-like [Ipomoea triloba]|uniref:MDIS1-interacting receptor like kinase 2-like n=1 Tax=Ipomoea triloba TaxID=35885 RepID=UPI00125D39C4|nr:MDIS1-interacting receptor like kinase 2-like [Ipomoea triloba]